MIARDGWDKMPISHVGVWRCWNQENNLLKIEPILSNHTTLCIVKYNLPLGRLTLMSVHCFCFIIIVSYLNYFLRRRYRLLVGIHFLFSLNIRQSTPACWFLLFTASFYLKCLIDLIRELSLRQSNVQCCFIQQNLWI